jgi:hypothetical protein
MADFCKKNCYANTCNAILCGGIASDRHPECIVYRRFSCQNEKNYGGTLVYGSEVLAYTLHAGFVEYAGT